MIIDNGGFGNAGGRIAMGNDLPHNFAPQSRLHLHQTTGNVFLRFTNNLTGAGALDGFVVGALNGTVNGDAALIQYEPNPVRFFIPDINVIGVSLERMQLTYGGQMGNGTADGLRIFNPGYINSTANVAFNAIDIYTGINNTTHIRFDNGGNIDTEQLLFKNTARVNGFWFNAAPTAVQYPTFKARYVFNIDSVEVMRIGTGLGMGSNVPPGPNAWNVNEGFVRIGEQPATAAPVDAGNRLEIDAFPNTLFSTPNPSCAGSTGFSGLRFTDLTSASAPCNNPPTTNVLSVDVNGDVILVPGGGLGFGGVCGNTNFMTSDFEIPMGTFNYVFTGQGIGTTSVGIGTAPGVCTPLPAKLTVNQSNGSLNSISILGRNSDPSSCAVMAINAGAGGTSTNPQVGGWFQTIPDQYAVVVPKNGGFVSIGYATTVTGPSFSWNGTFTTAVPTAMVDVAGSIYMGGLLVNASDVTLKHDVVTITNALDRVLQLRGVNFEWNTAEDSVMAGVHGGFIAQEVDTVIPEVVHTNANGIMSIAYSELIPYLVEALKEEHLRNDSLATRLDSLSNVVAGCCSSNARTSDHATNEQDVTLTNSESIVLNQNVPNPFAEQTTITYRLPESVVKAQMMFYDMNGKLIQVVDLDGRGAGQLNVFADDLSNGIYTYALVADGQVIDTKQMVKSK